ncbi:MAG: leucyl aminopeptidase [Candidatus Eisenbacteria bacterium]|nr:leucyl aminopeptidase [Candidatus Latescibacterota bacterium]MBD3301673.1 leucyl aminopeptidase [Candidatus Eisenbacteria bacterium]
MSHESVQRMKISAGDLTEVESKVAIVGLYEKPKVEGPLAKLDRGSGGLLGAAVRDGDFKGEKGETLLLLATRGKAKRILLVGLGARDALDAERIRVCAAAAARKCRDAGFAQATALLFGQGSPVSADEAAQAFAEGAILGTYRYVEYHTEGAKDRKLLKKIDVLVPDRKILAEAKPGLQRGVRIAEATNYTRTLAAHPGNHATPSFLASEARRIAKEQRLKATVLDRARMEKLGMGALLAVSQGSDQPPYLILLEYDCGDRSAPTVALVGKGLTFDSGGISIKPAAKMDEMKYDMCGGAAVLGVMSAVRDLEIPVNVIAAVPASENLSGASAYKPGDVLKSYSGKTIEVLNCDAEGRLILADALSYVARKHKPDAIVDMATLTGAVIVALGHYGAGLVSTDDELAADLVEAAERSGDRIWRLPLWEEMNDHLKTDFADLKNIGDGSAGAGTIVGGAFLSNFVDGIPWAHVDIAGTAWWDRDRPHLPKGPTGYGVRLIVDLLRNWKK